MLVRRRRNVVSGINATSVSDISFMLLTFFLVITSMDADKGLMQQLPPQDTDKNLKETVVSKDNLLAFVVTKENLLFMNGKQTGFSGLRDAVENFVMSRGEQHVISVEVAPEANYNTYFLLQNEIAAAYNKIRNRIAVSKYGQRFSRCTKQQKEDIRIMCPQRITEIYSGKEDTHADI